jgi:hypothetical protein
MLLPVCSSQDARGVLDHMKSDNKSIQANVTAFNVSEMALISILRNSSTIPARCDQNDLLRKLIRAAIKSSSKMNQRIMQDQ